MKQRILLVLGLTAVVGTSWALWVNACDENKQTTAQAGHVKTTAVVAGASGSCSSKNAATASGECPYHSSMTTAGASGCPHATSATTATTASMSGGNCAAHGTSATTASYAGADGCTGHGAASATTASNHDGCAMKGASATTASNGGHDCCASKSSSATAMAHGDCDGIGAGMIGAPACAQHSATASAHMKGECDACAEMVNCASTLNSNATQTQIVPLKNGVMFVYTSDTRAHVRAVQNAVARRNDKLTALATSGDRAKLCPDCKNVRGAIASGKLVRETVNTEGGCLTLVTSTDPTMVAKLRALASNATAMNVSRTKS